VSGTGNVGIGTANPLQRLHVNGSIQVGSRPLITWWTEWIQQTGNNLAANATTDMTLACSAEPAASPLRAYRMPVNIVVSGCVVLVDNDGGSGTYRIRVYADLYSVVYIDETTETITGETSVRMHFTTPFAVPEDTLISLRVNASSGVREFSVQLFGYQYT